MSIISILCKTCLLQPLLSNTQISKKCSWKPKYVDVKAEYSFAIQTKTRLNHIFLADSKNFFSSLSHSCRACRPCTCPRWSPSASGIMRCRRGPWLPAPPTPDVCCHRSRPPPPARTSPCSRAVWRREEVRDRPHCSVMAAHYFSRPQSIFMSFCFILSNTAILVSPFALWRYTCTRISKGALHASSDYAGWPDKLSRPVHAHALIMHFNRNYEAGKDAFTLNPKKTGLFW